MHHLAGRGGYGERRVVEGEKEEGGSMTAILSMVVCDWWYEYDEGTPLIMTLLYLFNDDIAATDKPAEFHFFSCEVMEGRKEGHQERRREGREERREEKKERKKERKTRKGARKDEKKEEKKGRKRRKEGRKEDNGWSIMMGRTM